MLDAHTLVPADDLAPTGEPAAASSRPAVIAPEGRRATALPLRNDTLLGVCEAIGQDFGFNANLLRIAFAIGLFFSPAGTIGVYLALGVAVAAARWFYPAKVRQAPKSQQPAAEDDAALPLAA